MNILFQIIPQLAKEFSGDSILSTSRICLQLWYFALSRKFLGFSRDLPIQISYKSQVITFYFRYTIDLAVLREIFIEKEYEWCPIVNPKVIIDLGAHFGDTSLYYHACFPGAKIISVEPSQENYERLVKHTKDIPNIVPIQAAIGSKDGEITLNLSQNKFGHSVIKRAESDNSVTVPMVSLSTLFKQQRVNIADLIKFDIEGAEFDLFKDPRFREYGLSYIGELHFDMSDNLDLEGVKVLFTGFDTDFEQLSNEQRFIVKIKQGSASYEKNDN